MPNQFSDTNFYKADQVRYLVAKGWIQPGVASGTNKLTASGVEKAKLWLNALDAEAKALIKLYLNSSFSETFAGTGAVTAFTVKNFPLTTDLPVVTVAGVTKTLTTDYSYNAATGVFTFVVAPVNAAAIVITYTADLSGKEALVDKLM